MLNHSNSNLLRLAGHQVGNPTNGEKLVLSETELDVASDALKALLLKFFLSPFSSQELYHFTFSNEDFSLNPIYIFSQKIFATPESFHEHSADIAKHLYQISTHPQIKPGDLFVAYFENVILEDEVTDAIGIFKSENKSDFINLLYEDNDFSLIHQAGISVDKLDKGCLIFNTEEDQGFKVCIVDKTNKSSEAQFWRDQFLNLSIINNDSQQTRNFLDLTKNFLTDQFPEEFNVSKADQIELLNRSIEYFKDRDEFNKREFENEVLQDSDVIKSFRSFNHTYDMDISDSFAISAEVVKKQSRIFKSVLKLDRNFHIYIHGDKNLIERGVDDDGRKYYKIYYDQES